MMKRIAACLCLLVCSQAFAVESSVELCRTAEGAALLYAGQKNFDGVSKTVLENGHVVAERLSAKSGLSQKELLAPFEVYSDSGDLVVKSSAVSFDTCVEMTKACAVVSKSSVKPVFSCIPGITKVSVTVFSKD